MYWTPQIKTSTQSPYKLCITYVLIVWFSPFPPSPAGVSFWKKSFTMTCPDKGEWYKGDIKLDEYGEKLEQEYNDTTKGHYHCRYLEEQYHFYVKGKGKFWASPSARFIPEQVDFWLTDDRLIFSVWKLLWAGPRHSGSGHHCRRFADTGSHSGGLRSGQKEEVRRSETQER